MVRTVIMDHAFWMKRRGAANLKNSHAVGTDFEIMLSDKGAQIPNSNAMRKAFENAEGDLRDAGQVKSLEIRRHLDAVHNR
jgi:hypothetical protein